MISFAGQWVTRVTPVAVAIPYNGQFAMAIRDEYARLPVAAVRSPGSPTVPRKKMDTSIGVQNERQSPIS